MFRLTECCRVYLQTAQAASSESQAPPRRCPVFTKKTAPPPAKVFDVSENGVATADTADVKSENEAMLPSAKCDTALPSVQEHSLLSLLTGTATPPIGSGSGTAALAVTGSATATGTGTVSGTGTAISTGSNTVTGTATGTATSAGTGIATTAATGNGGDKDKHLLRAMLQNNNVYPVDVSRVKKEISDTSNNSFSTPESTHRQSTNGVCSEPSPSRPAPATAVKRSLPKLQPKTQPSVKREPRRSSSNGTNGSGTPVTTSVTTTSNTESPSMCDGSSGERRGRVRKKPALYSDYYSEAEVASMQRTNFTTLHSSDRDSQGRRRKIPNQYNDYFHVLKAPKVDMDSALANADEPSTSQGQVDQTEAANDSSAAIKTEATATVQASELSISDAKEPLNDSTSDHKQCHATHHQAEIVPILSRLSADMRNSDVFDASVSADSAPKSDSHCPNTCEQNVPNGDKKTKFSVISAVKKLKSEKVVLLCSRTPDGIRWLASKTDNAPDASDTQQQPEESADGRNDALTATPASGIDSVEGGASEQQTLQSKKHSTKAKSRRMRKKVAFTQKLANSESSALVSDATSQSDSQVSSADQLGNDDQPYANATTTSSDDLYVASYVTLQHDGTVGPAGRNACSQLTFANTDSISLGGPAGFEKQSKVTTSILHRFSLADIKQKKKLSSKQAKRREAWSPEITQLCVQKFINSLSSTVSNGASVTSDLMNVATQTSDVMQYTLSYMQDQHDV
jgi:hypothetical protein